MGQCITPDDRAQALTRGTLQEDVRARLGLTKKRAFPVFPRWLTSASPTSVWLSLMGTHVAPYGGHFRSWRAGRGCRGIGSIQRVTFEARDGAC